MQYMKSDDPRIGRNYISWDIFRRKQLDNICKLEMIHVREGATHQEMKVVLEAKGIDPFKYKDIIFLGALHDSGEDRAKNLEITVREMPVKAVIEDVMFDRMRMYELRHECTLQGIVWAKTDKKIDLVAKIREKMNGNAT